jgi:hypothetical protein
MPDRTPRTAPYPASPVVARLNWDAGLHRLDGTFAGDNWPLTWTDRDDLFTSFNDGFGLSKGVTNYTLGFARVTGTPPDVDGADARTNIDTPVGWGRDGIKASGLLMVNGTLYLFVRNFIVGDDWRHARLAWSQDGGATWTWADWHFADTFGCPAFVQFGRNYADARDGYVYVLSQDGNDAYAFHRDIVLARVPRACGVTRK